MTTTSNADAIDWQARAEAAEAREKVLREALRAMVDSTVGQKVGGGDGGTFIVKPASGAALNMAFKALEATRGK